MLFQILVLLLCNLPFIWCTHSVLQQDNALLNLSFQSLNYRNILHWNKQNNLTASTDFYSVQYKVYGDKQWTTAKHCQRISLSYCDLTQETSDPREWYYARVQASSADGQSAWTLSPRFCPQWETSLTPPRIRLQVTKQGIMIHLKAPRTPHRKPNGRHILVTKYQRVTFRLHVLHNDLEEESHDIDGCATELLLENLRPRTTYCLQAESFIALQGHGGTIGQKLCVTTL
ncbi:interleukin-22 receptor subunit alpha-2 [Denticeps clupeoides]|uniref:Uncharacterized protein n=1 Tax=Denticeps clupeoides TaxID=299321 RepID=A0AAY4CM98_9TELE|nr:interleukin-22 receptor subunit alpha-2-like [Denticeps clupeoides]